MKLALKMKREVCKIAVAVCAGLAVLVAAAPAQAQYHLKNLVSNQLNARAASTDPLLVNAWGLARGATSPWWVADNLSGWSTLYTATGAVQGLKVLIPTAGNGPANLKGLNGPGTPTGVVFNGSSEFQVQGKHAVFLFATLDGTISAWAPGVNANQATLVVDNPAPNTPTSPMYTGLAITNRPSGNLLYAADNTNDRIDMYDGSFKLVKSFGDPAIPPTFSVNGVQDINGLVYVAYAAPDPTVPDGFVDVFEEDGTFVKTLIEGLPLNQAWGIALAPSNFGPLSNTLLVSNNSKDGTINGFNPKTGEFVGTIRNAEGRKIIFNNTWAIAFGSGIPDKNGVLVNGAQNELFVTVGPGNGAQTGMAGTFVSIVFDPDHDDDDEGGQH